MKLVFPAKTVLRKVAAAALVAGATFTASVVAVLATSLDPSDPVTGLVLLAANTFGPVLTAYLTKESAEILKDAIPVKE